MATPDRLVPTPNRYERIRRPSPAFHKVEAFRADDTEGNRSRSCDDPHSDVILIDKVKADSQSTESRRSMQIIVIFVGLSEFAVF